VYFSIFNKDLLIFIDFALRRATAAFVVSKALVRRALALGANPKGLSPSTSEILRQGIRIEHDLSLL
jgi:hypothetical protein